MLHRDIWGYIRFIHEVQGYGLGFGVTASAVLDFRVWCKARPLEATRPGKKAGA